MKPGKPFAFGKVGKSAYLGLPGNPVSAWVTFSLLCRPFILKLNGKEPGRTLFTMARTNFFYENINSRREFLRVTVDSKGIYNCMRGKTLKYCLQFVFVMD